MISNQVPLVLSRSFGVDAAALPSILAPTDSKANGLAFDLPPDLLPSATHVAFDLELDSDVGCVLIIGFWPKGATAHSIGGRWGLLPHVPTRVTVPLSALDGQTLFLPRTPLRLKSTVQGRRTTRDELSEVVIGVDASPAPLTLKLLSPPVLCEGEPDYPPFDQVLVDELGQWTARDWPGKTRNEAELVSTLRAARTAAQAETPVEATHTPFGGSGEIRFNATGQFRTHHDGRRWWLVDPDGGAFLSVGPDCVNPGSGGPVLPGTERNFAWLPRADDARFAPAVRGNHVDFATANLIRAFGDEHLAAWTDVTRALLRRYGFNTVANWSSLSFARGSGMPYVVPMPHLPFHGTTLFRSLPDVFDPAFDDACVKWADWLQPFSGDRNFVGYFLTNEPDWAFGKHNLASEMLEASPGTLTRRALERFVRDRYANDDAAWARAWDAPGKTFESLVTDVWRRAEYRSKPAHDDLFDFSREIVRRWMRSLAEPCRAVLPGVLNLGVRWAWISSDLCYEVAPWCDVFTINNYDAEPPLGQLTEVEKRTGKPVIIGEFHHGAIDRGLPSTGISAVSTTAERGVAYRRYVETAVAHPACVGAHVFQFADQPLMGRFDGENYNIGLVDVCHRPYAELLDAAKTTHDRVYAIANGDAPPVAAKSTPVPAIYF